MPAPTNSQRKSVAVITGASQGLGLALAEALAERGWALVVDARRADRLGRTVARVAPRTEVMAVVGDVTDPAHRQALADAARTLGTVRLVVNNASTLGESPLPTLDRISPEVLRDTFATNVIAPIALLQALAPVTTDDATIVNITSDAAVEPYEGWGGYGASKAALEHASRILAAEQPTRRVLVVDPGDMRTEMHQDAFPGEDISDRPLPEAIVPALIELIESDQTGGRYKVPELVS
jgi:NAD(P)-dependent dehydrogenase (short-subunit alcohol dehydrogenase family)